MSLAYHIKTQSHLASASLTCSECDEALYTQDVTQYSASESVRIRAATEGWKEHNGKPLCGICADLIDIDYSKVTPAAFFSVFD